MRSFPCFLLCSALFVSAHAETRIKVSQHGAIADGKTLDTAAIQRAIDACARAGGGTVVLTAGRYLSGTFFLRSQVNLHLETGARLIGTSDLARYLVPAPTGSPPEVIPGNQLRGLIAGENLENIAITGPGIIDGNKVFNPHGEEKRRGPHTITFRNCRRVTVSDVTIVDSANYAIYFSASDDVEIRNASFVGGWDGVHWRGTPERWCRNVNIIGCRFSTGDDAIAGRYWDHTVIRDCTINSSCNGIRLIGPATRLTISDNQFSGPGKQPHRTSGRTNMLGAIYLQPGGWDATTGPLDDVLIENNVMKDVASPVTVCVKPGNTVGNITVDGLRATGVYRAAMSVETWAETPIDQVVLRNVRIDYTGGGTASQAAENVPPPKIDPRSLPVWGLYARNVRKLTLDDVHLTLASRDMRPVTKFDRVGQVDRKNFRSTPVANE
jgi:polygalacturonase